MGIDLQVEPTRPIPSRVAIKRYDTPTPDKTHEQFNKRYEEKQAVRDEAARRFDITLQYVNAAAFLVNYNNGIESTRDPAKIKLQTPTNALARPDTIRGSRRYKQEVARQNSEELAWGFQDYDLYHDVAERSFWDLEDAHAQLEDPYVQAFLKQAVGLTLFAQKQTEEYASIKGIANIPDQDPIVTAIKNAYAEQLKQILITQRREFNKKIGLPYTRKK